MEEEQGTETQAKYNAVVVVYLVEDLECKWDAIYR